MPHATHTAYDAFDGSSRPVRPLLDATGVHDRLASYRCRLISSSRLLGATASSRSWSPRPSGVLLYVDSTFNWGHVERLLEGGFRSSAFQGATQPMGVESYSGRTGLRRARDRRQSTNPSQYRRRELPAVLPPPAYDAPGVRAFRASSSVAVKMRINLVRSKTRLARMRAHSGSASSIP